MTTHTDSATAVQLKTITIKRKMDLTVDQVWKAWSNPETFKQWWGPREYSCPYCSIDFSIGGKYLAAMRNKEGKDIWSTGTYREIVPQQKIVYTDSFADSEGRVVDSGYYDMPGMPLQLLVTVTVERSGDKTNMTLKHEGIPEEMYEDCIKGWQSSFDKMEEIMF